MTTTTTITDLPMKSIVETMLRQEIKYRLVDWIHGSRYRCGETESNRPKTTHPLHCQESHFATRGGYAIIQDEERENHIEQAEEPVDEDCRSKMASWMYEVGQFCRYQADTCEVALRLLDRFMVTPASARARTDRTHFQLVCMVLFYTSAKINETRPMSPDMISQLSKGAFSPALIERTERRILAALQWNVNPPTIMAFLREALQTVASSLLHHNPGQEEDDGIELQHDIWTLACLQAEIAMSQYRFVTIKPSEIAYIALMNALESCWDTSDSETMALTLLQKNLASLLAVDMGTMPCVMAIQDDLFEALCTEQCFVIRNQQRKNHQYHHHKRAAAAVATTTAVVATKGGMGKATTTTRGASAKPNTESYQFCRDSFDTSPRSILI